ncbi:MAG TPA: hypothetical protein VKX31_08540 [Brumimicrobium sp.]|nr:hypothetical protein [Brumimicrobium sp.]
MKFKIFSIILFFGVVFISCSEVDEYGCPKGSVSPKFTPAEITLPMKVYKNDNTLFDNDEVKISNGLVLENGALISSSSQGIFWFNLGRIVNYDGEESEYFGVACMDCDDYWYIVIGGGPSTPCGFGTFDFWELDKYYLVNYPNQTTDTLMVRDLRTPEIEREFYYFINGNQVYLEEETLSDGYTFSYLRLQQPE